MQERHEKISNKDKDTVEASSSKPIVPESQKALRMEVEEEKLDFEIEDELQLKVQNDEVLDGDDDDAKVRKIDLFILIAITYPYSVLFVLFILINFTILLSVMG